MCGTVAERDYLHRRREVHPIGYAYANHRCGSIGVDDRSSTRPDAANATVRLSDLPNDASCLGDRSAESLLRAWPQVPLVVI